MSAGDFLKLKRLIEALALRVEALERMKGYPPARLPEMAPAEDIVDDVKVDRRTKEWRNRAHA